MIYEHKKNMFLFQNETSLSFKTFIIFIFLFLRGGSFGYCIKQLNTYIQQHAEIQDASHIRSSFASHLGNTTIISALPMLIAAIYKTYSSTQPMQSLRNKDPIL